MSSRRRSRDASRRRFHPRRARSMRGRRRIAAADSSSRCWCSRGTRSMSAAPRRSIADGSVRVDRGRRWSLGPRGRRSAIGHRDASSSLPARLGRRGARWCGTARHVRSRRRSGPTRSSGVRDGGDVVAAPGPPDPRAGDGPAGARRRRPRHRRSVRRAGRPAGCLDSRVRGRCRGPAVGRRARPPPRGGGDSTSATLDRADEVERARRGARRLGRGDAPVCRGARSVAGDRGPARSGDAAPLTRGRRDGSRRPTSSRAACVARPVARHRRAPGGGRGARTSGPALAPLARSTPRRAHRGTVGALPVRSGPDRWEPLVAAVAAVDRRPWRGARPSRPASAPGSCTGSSRAPADPALAPCSSHIDRCRRSHPCSGGARGSSPSTGATAPTCSRSPGPSACPR